MTAAFSIPASFYSHPYFDVWRGKARCEMRFTRLMRVLQGNSADSSGQDSVRLTLKQWKACLSGALQSVLDWLREGAAYGYWTWDEAEGRLELAAWVWEEPALPQTALPLFEETRSPSKQPEARRAYQQGWRAKKTTHESSAPSDASVPAQAAPAVPTSPAFGAPPAPLVGSETSYNASYTPSYTEANVGNVGTDDTALASLAEASVCIHTRAKARASSLAARVKTSAKYPRNQMAPSEADINHLLQIGYAPAQVEEAVGRAQDTPNVQQNGGIGEWVTYLQRKLPPPDAARTGRLDMLVASEAKPPGETPQAQAQTNGETFPRDRPKLAIEMSSDERRALMEAGIERDKQAKLAREHARKAG